MRKPGQRLLYIGYARVLQTIVAAPVVWSDLHDRLGLSRASAQRMLHTLHDLGLVHIGAWRAVPCGRRHQTTPVYTFGPGADAPWPGAGSASRRLPGKPPVELLTFVRAIEAIQDEPLHGRALADAVGIAPRTAQALLRELHALGLIFKAEYQIRRYGGLGYPLYAWGPGRRDRVKPKPQPVRVLQARGNAIKKARREHLRVIYALAAPRNVFAQQTILHERAAQAA